jgi:hypothetical protein
MICNFVVFLCYCEHSTFVMLYVSEDVRNLVITFVVLCVIFRYHALLNNFQLLRSTKKRLATLSYDSKGEFTEDITSNAVIRNRVLGGNGNLRPVKLVQVPRRKKEILTNTASGGGSVGAPKKKITYVCFPIFFHSS